MHLRHPFGISRGTDTQLPTVLLELDGGGLGEASPVRYLGQSAESQAAALTHMLAALPDSITPAEASALLARQFPSDSAARAAVDMALLDRAARTAREPLWRYLDAPEPTGRTTSYTVALDSREAMLQRAAETAGTFDAIKVKLGRDPRFDADVLAAIRRLRPDARISVDANGGWTPETAPDLLRTMADAGVEFVEQPLPKGQLAAWPALKRAVPLPLVADEDLQGPESLSALQGIVDGINIKIMKCGGPTAARELISAAQFEGWMIMIGCMIETSVGIASASHLAGFAEWLDLDGALLTKNDPWRVAGRPADLPLQEIHAGGPGLGVVPAA